MNVKLGDKVFAVHSAGEADVASLPMGAEKRNKSKKKKSYYINDFGTFDIETTSDIQSYDKFGRFASGYGYMYVWQFYTKTTGLVMGRTWSDFITLLKRIGQHYHESENDPFFVVYDHNLPFEFAFMADQFYHEGLTGQVFAVKSRKVVTYRLDIGIEFRCSLKLTNRGLAKYMSDMPAGFEKLVGDLDYRVKRTPLTVLTEEELSYCAADVIGLWHSLDLDFRTTGDTVASVPLTLTGYVRRELKAAVKQDKSYSYLLSRGALTPEQFMLVRDLAKGGDTLASASQLLGVVNHNIGSADYKSSYPARLCISKYPMGKFSFEGSGMDIDLEILQDIEDKGRYFITQFEVYDLVLKDKTEPIPCITLSTTYDCEGGTYYNGRVLKAKRLAMAMDMISFRLFKRQYKFSSIRFGKTYSCIYDYLPKVVREFVYHYFELKCKLDDKRKHYPKGSKEREAIEIDYALAKGRLNAIYGMFYTSPLHGLNEYDEEEGWKAEVFPVLCLREAKEFYAGQGKTDAELQQIVDENCKKLYQNQCSAAGLYIWGVHTASLGRYALDELIQAVGKWNILYSDTDSAKFRYCHEALEGLRKLNERLKKEAIEAGAYVDTGENVYYLGVAEDETEDERYSEFVTLGAKKYAYRDSHGLHITLSGVRKECVSQLHDDITEFSYGKVFNPAGGIMLHYIDKPLEVVHVVGDDGTECDILLGNNICCEERIITLGGIVDERFGEDYNVFAEIFGSLPDD